MATATPHLPAGWEASWDSTHNSYYYFNRALNITQWHAPGPATASTLAAGYTGSVFTRLSYCVLLSICSALADHLVYFHALRHPMPSTPCPLPSPPPHVVELLAGLRLPAYYVVAPSQQAQPAQPAAAAAPAKSAAAPQQQGTTAGAAGGSASEPAAGASTSSATTAGGSNKKKRAASPSQLSSGWYYQDPKGQVQVGVS